MCKVLKQFTEGKGRNLGLTDFGIFCEMWRVTPPPTHNCETETKIR